MSPTAADLARFELLAALPDAALEGLALAARTRALGDGEALFTAGQPARSMFGIARGRIVLRASTAGRSTIVMNAGAGELLGWSALREGATWLTTGQSVGDSEIVELAADAVIDLLASGSSASRELIRRLFGLAAEHLAETQAQLLRPGQEGPITGG